MEIRNRNLFDAALVSATVLAAVVLAGLVGHGLGLLVASGLGW